MGQTPQALITAQRHQRSAGARSCARACVWHLEWSLASGHMCRGLQSRDGLGSREKAPNPSFEQTRSTLFARMYYLYYSRLPNLQAAEHSVARTLSESALRATSRRDVGTWQWRISIQDRASGTGTHCTRQPRPRHREHACGARRRTHSQGEHVRTSCTVAHGRCARDAEHTAARKPCVS